MYYEIIVIKNGKHFFATAERSIQNDRELREIYHALALAFPVDQGYELHVMRYEKVGYMISTEDLQ